MKYFEICIPFEVTTLAFAVQMLNSLLKTSVIHGLPKILMRMGPSFPNSLMLHKPLPGLVKEQMIYQE